MNKSELRVLIVDDDPEDILLTESLLREGLKGVALELDKANSFTEGLNQVERAHYDVCFFDYQLGERNGLDLIRACATRVLIRRSFFSPARGERK
jgi:CheY-like chemotaxis protein